VKACGQLSTGVWASSFGSAKMFTFIERSIMAKKIDPLNKKQYGAVSAMLTVSDIKAAVAFYQKVFGFAKRGIMNGPDGKPMHAELTLRGTTLMLGPENPALGRRSAKTVGSSPASLFLYVENVDKVVAKAVGLGATAQGQVTDMFWGDRCGTLVDPEGYTWMVGTHKAEPTSKEMKKKMSEQMGPQTTGATTVAA
jgi:PhnB protein